MKQLYEIRSPLSLIFLHRVKSIIRAYVKFLTILLKYRRDLQHTRQLKSSKTSKSCLIIANGPSALSLDYKKIKRDKIDVIVMNGFLNSKISDILSPDYYIISDPRYQFSGSSHLTSNYKLRNSALQDYLLSHSATLICPVETATPDNLQAIKFCHIEHTQSQNFSDLTRPQGCMRSTAMLALVFAEHMQYNQIAVIGLDNTYFKYLECDRENRLNYELPHIASEGRLYLDQVEGFYNDIGKYIYFDHRLFSDLNYFNVEKITNLDLDSLNTAFKKKTLEQWIATI